MTPTRGLVFAALAAPLLLAGPASAHIQLVAPVQRHSEQKSGPCGIGAGDMRGPNVTTYAPGETIVVSWTEGVDHPGHFRVSFDADGFDDFVDPASYDELNSNDAVLVDGIADKNGGLYEVEVTLPDIECDNCTLQVIQVMTDKPPYEIGTNDLYYQCADLRLVGAVTATTGEPGTDTGGETTGGTDASTGADPSAGASTGSPHPGHTTGGGETTGGGGPTTGAVDPTTGDTGPAPTSAATDPVDGGGDDDKGCGCRGDAGGSGLLGLLALPLAWRRRRA